MRKSIPIILSAVGLAVFLILAVFAEELGVVGHFYWLIAGVALFGVLLVYTILLKRIGEQVNPFLLLAGTDLAIGIPTILLAWGNAAANVGGLGGLFGAAVFLCATPVFAGLLLIGLVGLGCHKLRKLWKRKQNRNQ